ncbi:MAG: biopolymer transporter ExbD [Roseivivax sp.]|nr:biopolymer transporter ExbD [Roseivivax sp.]
MAQPFRLTRPRKARNAISIAPMIDVMLILLIFFMVTSTYLDLNMIPAVSPRDDAPAAGKVPDRGETLILTIGADGTPSVQGRGLSQAGLAAMIAERLARHPDLQIVVLPSGGAQMQALVAVMDTAAAAGAVNMRIVRVEARP